MDCSATRFRHVALFIVPLVLLVACSGVSDDVDASSAPIEAVQSPLDAYDSVTSNTREDSAAMPLADILAEIDDTDFQQAAEFWASYAVIASEVEHYRSIDAMADGATAVVVARVGRLAEGRVVSDPESGDSVTFADLSVDVLRVLAGELPTLDGAGHGTITVESVVTPRGEPGSELTLLFLRWKGEKPSRNPALAGVVNQSYRLVSGQGVFIEGPDGARNPLGEAQYGFLEDNPAVPADPIINEVMGRSLGDLIQQIESRGR